MPFSVLMSLYAKERPEYLRESLESVFNQTLPPDEVILVEDGPVTVELENVVEEFLSAHEELRIIKTPVNRGLGPALNEGLKHCSHELVARMDTDDISVPYRFEKQSAFMNNNPEIQICSSWLQEFEGTPLNKIDVKEIPKTHEEIEEYIKLRNPLNHPSVMFRKQPVLKVGGYQPFPLFEDYYLWTRMFVDGCKFANIPECLVYFRTSPDMYKRRGGWRYAVDSAKFQLTLHKLGIKSLFSAFKDSIIRGIIYILPNSFRSFVYSRFLRKNIRRP